MQFNITHTDPFSKARTGTIHTAHGTIKTPIFMPVGTQGSVKTVQQYDLQDTIKAQIILGNTYHLYLRPGLEVLEKAGGLHKFIHWDKPILTDSGGFQVYSLAKVRKINQEGVVFQSHLDGSKHFFSPENVIDKQRSIGSDLIMAFDECTPYPCEYSYAKKSMHLTHMWLDRCRTHFEKTDSLYDYPQFLIPIIQGSSFKDLRKQAAEHISQQEWPAFAIGGVLPNDILYEMTDIITDTLPKEKPKYLMGVGTPTNLLEGIALGVDMFDCVMPSRNARNGMLFTSKGIINIKNKKWALDFSPLDSDGTNLVDNYYSKAYVRHLFKVNESLAKQIATLHNLSFYLWLVNQAQNNIAKGTFLAWKNIIIPQLNNRL